MNWKFLPPFLSFRNSSHLRLARYGSRPGDETIVEHRGSRWKRSDRKIDLGHLDCIRDWARPLHSILGNRTSFASGEILKGKIDDLSKAEKIGELPASAWKVVLVGDSKFIASDYTGGIHIGSLSEPGAWKKTRCEAEMVKGHGCYQRWSRHHRHRGWKAGVPEAR